MPLLTNPVKYISEQHKSDCYNRNWNKNHNSNHNIRMHIIRKTTLATLIQSGNHFDCIVAILPAVYEPEGKRFRNIMIHKKNIPCLYHTDKTECPCPDA